MLNIPAGWKPIESAPKDGSLILLGCPDEGPDGRPALCLPGHWLKGWGDAPDEKGQDDGWVAVTFNDFFPGRSFGNPHYMYEGSQPTHWMPLPAAPGSPASVAPGDAQDEQRIARWKRDSELLLAIQNSCWDVRFISHSNGDDYDIGIEIVSHFMQPPCERVIGENGHEDLRAALEQALTAKAYPPARPDRHAAPAAGDARKGLTAAQIEAGWRQTFSTDNPYCPCNLKSFTKAVRWAECAIAAQQQGEA